MKWKKTIYEVIDWMKSEESIAKNIVHWETVQPKEAQSVPFPKEIDERLLQSLTNRGISSLYTHQGAAFEAAIHKRHFVAVTPTASGKTLCYNLPVLQKIVQNNDARALYLFPTKALAQDQKSELNEVITQMGVPINSYTYDGDTAPTIRQKVRKAGHIVITNPDMLHSAILPHHTKWVSLFENLEYIVIDELHTYRGVFGSHVANVIRRLKRICNFYGSNPTFICTSATIANPKELAQELTGESFELINNNGAPSSKKHIVFYNPPIVNKPLNIRRSATLEVRKLAAEFLQEKIQTIVFAKSRVRVEILLTYLKELVKNQLGEKSIQGYRGGYLPTQRRAIEKGLRNGEIYGVISTNALELGVDIGQLQVCIMTGYPGTIASAWQQAGRAGRRQGEAVIVMVASSNPLDQYVIQHPEFFLKSNPESARINPNNLIILVDHIKCAAYELPFKKGDTFDGVELDDILDYLTEERVLHENGGKWHWMNDAFPAHNISLRSASQENVIIVDQSSDPANKVIGEMDRFSSMTLLHDEAIYLHQGVQYQVEKLDWEEKKAFVREVNVDYFTDADLAVSLDVLEVDKQMDYSAGTISFGDVSVRAMATIFKKIKFETHENIGTGPIYLPEEELQTSATWITLEEEITQNLKGDDLEKSLLGIAHALKHVAPLLLMCEPMDVQVVPQVKSTHDEKPVIYFYDRYPGGVGLSEKAFSHIDELLTRASELIGSCPCRSGCPSCIGADYPDEDSKQLALSLLGQLA